MSNELLDPNDSQAQLKKAFDSISQLASNMQIVTQTLSSLAFGFEALQTKVAHHDELFRKRIYLSNSHLREVSKQVRQRVSELCKVCGYDYHKSSRILFQAIYRDVNGQYNVPSYRELPEAYFEEIVETIRGWHVTGIIEQRIKESAA